METRRIFTTTELNEMLVEATLGAETKSVQGPGAEEKFQRIREEVAEMKRKGYVPMPAKDQVFIPLRHRNRQGLEAKSLRWVASLPRFAHALADPCGRGATCAGFQVLVDPGEGVYGGQVNGENPKTDDLVVNVLKGKQHTNMRASG